MDGYEFENLIGIMLRNMGFNVENTPLSGDGGIDLIATINKPIFKCTYLIQCKYWSSPVGEPAIRDLYGVVLANNANKGIVITNSTFTDKAIEFADNKNIELIDGNILNMLLDKYVNGNKVKVTSSKLFTEFDEFELEQYRYLIKRIERDKSNKVLYENLLNFYLNQLDTSKIEVLKAGLLIEIINFIHEYINRFCKRTKILLNEKKALQLILSNLYILNSDFSTALELIQDIGLFQLGPRHVSHGAIYDFLPNYYREEFEGTKFYNKDKSNIFLGGLMVVNLYQIFNEINYTNGIKFIEKIFTEYSYFTYKQLEDTRTNNDGMLISKNIKRFETFIEELRNRDFNVFYLPSRYSVDSKSWDVITDDKSFPTSVLLNSVLDKKEIESQIPTLDLILNSIS